MPLQNGSSSYLSNAKTGKTQYLKAHDLCLQFTLLAPSWPESSGAHLLALFHAFQLRLVSMVMGKSYLHMKHETSFQSVVLVPQWLQCSSMILPQRWAADSCAGDSNTPGCAPAVTFCRWWQWHLCVVENWTGSGIDGDEWNMYPSKLRKLVILKACRCFSMNSAKICQCHDIASVIYCSFILFIYNRSQLLWLSSTVMVIQFL